MKTIYAAALLSALATVGSAQAQTDTVPAAPAAPYRTDVDTASARRDVPCVRRIERVAPPPSPRSFRRQWPLATAGAVLGWLAADRVVGPRDKPLVILSASTLGSVVGSYFQARGEGQASLTRSVVGGVLGAVPAGAVLYLNRADRYQNREILTRGVVPVVGGALQGAVTAAATSSSLQQPRTLLIECPAVPAAPVPRR